jgi:acetyl-CoA synthetase
VSDVVWRPTPEYRDRAWITGFMTRHGVSSLAELHRRSVAEPEWFWDAVARDLDLRWTQPYRRVLDTSRGIPWPRWFEGGLLNLCANAVDRHLAGPGRDRPAVVAESDDGAVRTLTYAELARDVGRLAGALRRLGVGPGDTVGLFLPMGLEAAVALLAVTRLGAVYAPCFSGYGAPAVAARLQGCSATVLVTQDVFRRRGQVVSMKAFADEAVAASPSVRTVLVARRPGEPAGRVPWTPGRDLWWEEAVAGETGDVEAVPVEADHPALIIYTSGTTGKPKGTVLTHGGLALKVAGDMAFAFDVGPEDRVFWLTDLGWLMGPWLLTGALVRGATAVTFEGAPDHPAPDRLWALAARHRVTVMGLSPTAVRALMPHGESWVRRHDLSTLRILGSTGEPWNPASYHWLFETVGGGRLPIINYTGGTEISGGILGCFPIAPIKACAFTGPLPGMAAECYGDDGRPVRGQVGELVVTRPWPGMTRGFWQDDARYLETYWARWPDTWVHGDWAQVDEDGYWYLQGRSDDTLKIAGKRLGPAEVESALAGHPRVAESAAIGVPHPVKGEVVVCFVVLKAGPAATEALRAELADQVMGELGKALRPDRVLFVADLPRTRSAKIMRRVIRATHLGQDPGDLSSLENPAAVQAIALAK